VALQAPQFPTSLLSPTATEEEAEIVLPLRFVLRDATALKYFEEFLFEKCREGHILDFWHALNSFPSNCMAKLNAAAQKKDPQALLDTYGLLRRDALRLYNQFVSEEASPRVNLPASVAEDVRRLAEMDPYPPPTTFDAAKVGGGSWGEGNRVNIVSNRAQAHVWDMFRELYYPKFLKNDLYHRCLYELKTQQPDILEAVMQVCGN
jgi:hypothetical protein